MDPQLIVIVLLFLFAAVVAGVGIWLMMPARIDEAAYDEHTCTACRSRNLRIVDTGVWVCAECGYEGGPRRAEWEARRRRRGWDDQPDEARKQAALEDLLEAKRVGLAAAGDVGEYEMDLRPDAPMLSKAIADALVQSGNSRTHEEERESRRQRAIQDLIEVHGKMMAAAEKWPAVEAGVLPGTEKPIWTRAAHTELMSRVELAIQTVTTGARSG